MFKHLDHITVKNLGQQFSMYLVNG